MQTAVIYESMYGNTHQIAEAIAEGVRSVGDVKVMRADVLDAATLENFDLVIAGGPTHVRSISRPQTRRSAIEAANKPGSMLHVDASAGGPGLREWLDSNPNLPTLGAAFDTRVQASVLATGRASRAIARRLRALGCQLIAAPISFYVRRDNRLVDGELADARDWGWRIATDARAALSVPQS